MNDESLMEGIDETMSEEERFRLLNERMKALQEKNEIKQRKREVKCAQYLRARVKPYEAVQDPEDFAIGCREEAQKITKGAYGGLYCMTIGFAFEVAAEEYLGENSFLGFGSTMARTKRNASGFASNMKLIGAGIKAASAGGKAMREAEDLQKKAEEGEELGESEALAMMGTLNDSLPAFLECAWAINKRDIQSTLKEVCSKLFADASVPKDMRIKRAEGVQILGREFSMAGKRASVMAKSKDQFEADEIKARVAVATMTTMARAQGQEMTEEDQEELIEQAKKQMSMEPGSDVADDEHKAEDQSEGDDDL